MVVSWWIVAFCSVYVQHMFHVFGSMGTIVALIGEKQQNLHFNVCLAKSISRCSIQHALQKYVSMLVVAISSFSL